MPTEPFKIRNFIDGQFVEPVGGKYLDNIEPATGKPYSQVPDSEAADVELAVAAADKALSPITGRPDHWPAPSAPSRGGNSYICRRACSR